MKLSAPLLNHIGIYRLNLSFDRVLRAVDAMEDDILPDKDKISIAIKLLVRFPRPVWPASRIKLWGEIFDRCIKPKHTGDSSDQRSFDFAQDAEYIYAAFRQTYGIDLQAERGKLDWREFIALFQALPDNTVMSEIMSIRLREYPKQTEYNKDEIDALRKAKHTFALDIKHKPGERFDAGIAKQMDDTFAFYRGKRR